MCNFLIIPNRIRFSESQELTRMYPLSFEYNDFFLPSVLDDEDQLNSVIDFYRSLPRDRSRDTLHGAFFDVTVHSDDSLIRQVSEKRVRQSMEIASRLGVRGVVFHTNRLAHFLENSYISNWLIRNRDFFTDICREYPHITVLMENMFDESPEILARLGEEMAGVPNFGICLDLAHAALSDVSPEIWWNTLKPYIRHLHINDNDLSQDRHWAIGKGRIDWDALALLLSEARQDISILIEVSSPEAQRDSIAFILSHPQFAKLFDHQ